MLHSKSLSAFALTHFRSVFFEGDSSAEFLCGIFVACGQRVLDRVDAFPLRRWRRCMTSLRSILGRLQTLVLVDVAWTIYESLSDFDPDEQFRTDKLREHR